MGFSFRKRLKVMKGLYLNFSKNGVSTSIGGNVLTMNVGKNGTRISTSIPGTGIKYSKKISNVKNNTYINPENEVNIPVTIDNYNFVDKVPTPANKKYFYISIALMILGAIFIELGTLIVTVPIFLYVFFIQLGNEEKRIDKELQLI